MHIVPNVVGHDNPDSCFDAVAGGLKVGHPLMRNAVLLNIFFFIPNISNIEQYFILFYDVEGDHGHHGARVWHSFDFEALSSSKSA